MDAGVVPVKALDRAKSRLGQAYGDEKRAALVEALLEDTFSLCSSVSFLEWFFVSSDRGVLERAEQLGFQPIEEAGDGLNDALTQACTEIAALDFESVTVLPADLPLAEKWDLHDLVDTGATSDIVVVPSRNDGGTNGLYLCPPRVIEPRFGTQSFRAHLKEGEAKGVRCAILAPPRLGLDIDTVEDAVELMERGGESKTAQLLATFGAPSI
ncbi:MAG: 2-phospho-L-lactate guanylyltransferase [Actinomycetota bacterium]|nr:2-phospho-L-lactate guanylyltransferase [Actinomycetota bacterium]